DWSSDVCSSDLARQHALAVVRLNPTLEKSGGHRKAHGVRLDSFKLHAREPARENVFADFGPQSPSDAQPPFLIGLCHLEFFFSHEASRRGSIGTVRPNDRGPRTVQSRAKDFAAGAGDVPVGAVGRA